MAKVTVEFDTADKSLSVKMDGKEIADVRSISLYNYSIGYNGDRYDEDEEDKFGCTIEKIENNSDEGYSTVTCIRANETDKCIKIKAVDTLNDDVMNYWKSK